ncbi:MAG: Hpt domain-containing protein [Desulfobulbaceae bacterium]|nr:Hpt domain-containing protein [Desulfobulbaceae bacterium]
MSKTTDTTETTQNEKNDYPHRENQIDNSREELINRFALEKIRALQIEGAPDILSSIIGLYLKDTPGQLKKLYQALRADDAVEVRSVAHNLKTSCSNLGALSLSSLFKEIEHRGHTNSLRGTLQLLARAEIESLKIIEPLRAEMTNS